MTKTQLAEALKRLGEGPYDPEATHGDADALLLEYINSDEVSEAYDALDKWYS